MMAEAQVVREGAGLAVLCLVGIWFFVAWAWSPGIHQPTDGEGFWASLYRAATGRHWRWPKVRKEWLRKHPKCAACGGTEDCTPHHKIPVHLARELELDESNLITLCEGGGCNCHLVFGHLHNWQAFNPRVEEQAAEHRERIKGRKFAILRALPMDDDTGEYEPVKK